MAVNPKEITQRNFVSIKINGKSFFGDPSETILQISKRNGMFHFSQSYLNVCLMPQYVVWDKQHLTLLNL